MLLLRAARTEARPRWCQSGTSDTNRLGKRRNGPESVLLHPPSAGCSKKKGARERFLVRRNVNEPLRIVVLFSVLCREPPFGGAFGSLNSDALRLNHCDSVYGTKE